MSEMKYTDIRVSNAVTVSNAEEISNLMIFADSAVMIYKAQLPNLAFFDNNNISRQWLGTSYEENKTT